MLSGVVFSSVNLGKKHLTRNEAWSDVPTCLAQYLCVKDTQTMNLSPFLKCTSEPGWVYAPMGHWSSRARIEDFVPSVKAVNSGHTEELLGLFFFMSEPRQQPQNF